ncbi:ABC transporter permease [Bosea sp. 2RAB26]|uniref:ABC transporter permease n=1 Tax=Bosea sp. 2RAB26 TaxID=3237476 RepID=UPI003F93E57E
MSTVSEPAVSTSLQRHPALRPLHGRLNEAVTVAAALVALLCLAPLAFLIAITIQTGADTVVALVFRARVGELLLNTLLLELCVVPAAAALGILLAWLTERTTIPGARAWSWLAVAPLAVPAFVQGYAWASFAPHLHGLPGATLISVLAYTPFIYLPVVAQLRRLDPALEEIATSLGRSPRQVFTQVVLPQLRLPVSGGALLIGLHLLAEYGLFAMIRFDTFATAIIDQFQSSYNGPAANMLAGVLVLCCLGLLVLDRALRGRERQARVGSGAPRTAPRLKPGRIWTLPCLGLLLTYALLSLGVPSLTLGRWLVLGGADAWRISDLAGAFGTTVFYAVAGAALTSAAAIPIAWLCVRRPGLWQRRLEACHVYVGSLPGIVVALALVTITVRVALPLYQSWFMLLVAYALIFLPRALIGLRGSLAQVPVELEWAASALGRPPLLAVLQVTLRLAAPGLGAAMALVGLGITTELTATLLLSPNGTRTLATEFWSLTGEIDYVAATPYAVLMIILSIPMAVMLHRQSRKANGL